MPQQSIVTANGRTTIVPTGPVGPPGQRGYPGPPGANPTISATAPAAPQEGDLWFNTTVENLYFRYQGAWVVVVGPPAELVQGSGLVVTTEDYVTTVALGDRTAGRIMGRKIVSGNGPPEDLTVVEVNNLLGVDIISLYVGLLQSVQGDDGWQYPMTFDANLANTAASVTTANRCTFTRMRGRTSVAVNKATINVGVSSGNISVAVYANNGSNNSAARPTGAPILTTGDIACPAAGLAEVTFTGSAIIPLGAWFALTCDNTTATFSRAGSTLTPAGVCYSQASAHPAPTVGTLTVNGARFWGAVHA